MSVEDVIRHNTSRLFSKPITGTDADPAMDPGIRALVMTIQEATAALFTFQPMRIKLENQKVSTLENGFSEVAFSLNEVAKAITAHRDPVNTEPPADLATHFPLATLRK